MGKYFAVAFWFVAMATFFGCGGGGSEEPPPDGDSCPPGQMWVNGRCVDIDVDGDRDGSDRQDDAEPDIADGDEPDGDTDGDGIDGDADGDPSDGDTDDDAEESVEFEIDFQEDFIEREENYCQCQTDEDCGILGYACFNCQCFPPTDGDGDPECVSCSTHADCDPGSFCNPQSDCCDVAYRPSCTAHAQCPDWAYCSPFHECDFECLADADCEQLYPPGWCCYDRGRCASVSICQGADGDGGEEERCTSCDDCAEQFGSGYYCNVDTNVCQLGDCCEDSDCTTEPDGICNLHTGLCIYGDPPDEPGTILGRIQVNAAAADFVFWVEARYLNDDPAGMAGPLRPEQHGSEWYVDYVVFDLPYSSYNVFLIVEELEGESAYPFNPILLTADEPAAEDVDFYVGVNDPRLARISGDAALSAPYATSAVTVRLMKVEGGVLVEADAIPAGTLADGKRPFAFEGVAAGEYYVQGVLVHLGQPVEDFWSQKIAVELGGPPPDIDDIRLFFGGSSGDANLGGIAGAIHHSEFYDAEMFAVYLFDAANYPYPVATAALGAPEATSVPYTFSNVEAGSYWVQGWATIGGFTIPSTPPEPLRLDIEYGVANDLTGKDLYFDAVRPDKGSISGSLVIPESLYDRVFHVEVYVGDWTTLLREDPVLDLQYGETEAEAPFFIEALESGAYYLKAVGVLDEEQTTVTHPTGISIIVPSAEQDVTGITITFSE